MTGRNNESGMIAIVTLWIVAILSVIAVSLGYRVGIDLKIAGYHLDQVQATYLAKSGIYRAVAELKMDARSSEIDHLAESWNSNAIAFRDVSLDAGQFRVGHQGVSSGFSTINGGWDSEDDWTYGVVDEERKINVNTATDEVINRLSLLGLDMTLLVTKREGAEEATPPSFDETVGGASSTEISARDFPQLFPMNLFSSDEVAPEQFEIARKYLTVYGDGKVNVNTAGREVLLVLGMTDNLADRIIRYRSGPDGTEGTSDDTPFTNLETIATLLNEFGELTPQELADLTYFNSTEALTLKSHFFRINSTGFLNDGLVRKEIAAVLERTDENETIIRFWYES